MKQLTILMVLLVNSFLLSCSKSDNTEDVDPVFSLPYTPLRDLAELDATSYLYAGLKVEGRRSSMLTPTSRLCNIYDELHLNFNANQLANMKFSRRNKNCEGFKIVTLSKNTLVKEGVLRTNIYGSVDKLDKLIVDEQGRIDLEIGFQGDYLRIEDRMSNYSRHKYDEKVYLYFTRRDI